MIFAALLLQIAATFPAAPSVPPVLHVVPKHDELVYTFGGVPARYRIEPGTRVVASAFGSGFGALVGTDRTAMLGPEFPETTWRYEVDVKKNLARTTSGDGKQAWEVPLAPFLGCLGVAPEGGEVRTTIVPGNFGGNMDCPEVRAGNTVYLGVNVAGGLLSFGDGHYAMGEGEIMGAAVEGAMNSSSRRTRGPRSSSSSTPSTPSS
jgi:acetamidase/formamidase